jgi:F-box/WD-40 domain protein 7
LQFDGVHVVSGSLDTSIRVWDVETGACRHTLMGHQSLTSGMELRNNILVSGNADSTVKVWDIVSGHCLQTLSGPNKHQSAVTCLQFNSHFVITSSDDGTVKLWDVKTGAYTIPNITLLRPYHSTLHLTLGTPIFALANITNLLWRSRYFVEITRST